MGSIAEDNTLPAQVPQMGNKLTRSIGRNGLRLLGWRVEGNLPNLPKAIFAAAPHTSNWDFILAMFAVLSMGLKVSYLMKKEAFVWPLSGLFKALGGIPIDRGRADGLVANIAEAFAEQDRLWLAVTPEGTRSHVAKWKTGFLRVAHCANVPVVLVAWDYPNKRIVVDKTWVASEDFAEDAERVREYLTQKYTGRYPERQ